MQSGKKIFGWGLRIFCEWRHKWSSFWVILAHVARPRAQLLGQSVSLKVSLENSRLSSLATLHFCHCSSGYFRTDSHQPVRAYLAWFEVIRHIFINYLAFLLQLDLATWASAEIFPGGEQRRKFAYAFQVADDATQMDVHKAHYPF